MRKQFKYAAVLSVVIAVCVVTRAADQYGVAYERNAVVTMRDGVKLKADIYRPTADGKFPVLLQRTPYNKDNDVDFGFKAAARGFVVIVEDVRGRYASEGEWYTFKNEPNDGYDTIEWAAALPYSDGKVGMFGGSYVGRNANVGCHRSSAASCGNLSHCDRQQLSLELGLPGRSFRAMV